MFNGALALWDFFLVRFIWRFSFQGVGRGNPIPLDSHGKPQPSTFSYAWDIADEMPHGRDDRSSIGGLEPTFECLCENLGQWSEVAGPGLSRQWTIPESFLRSFRPSCLLLHTFGLAKKRIRPEAERMREGTKNKRFCRGKVDRTTESGMVRNAYAASE